MLGRRIFYILALFLENNHVYILDDLISFLDSLLGATYCGAEIIQLGVIDIDAEVRAPLAIRI